MARKATLDQRLRPDELAADEFAGDGAAPGSVLPAGPATGRRRQSAGAGGRWLVWLGRVVIWAVLIIIGFRGVASIVSSDRQADTGSTAASTASTAGSGFPATLAEAFVLQFGQVYLNFSPGSAAQRAAQLAPFIPAGASPQFGWNGQGTQSLQSEQVASVSVSSAHQATIAILATVTTGSASPGLIELGVPVYADHGGLVVSAEPALLPAPEQASPPPAKQARGDAATQAALATQLPGFFRAYASGDQQALARFVARGVTVTGLGGEVTFDSLSGMVVPAGGATRRISVTVTWQLPAPPAPPPTTPPASAKSRKDEPAPAPTPAPTPPLLQTTYEMTVVLHHGTWYVKAIGSSPQQPEGT